MSELAERFLAEYRPATVKDLGEYRRQARSVFKRILPVLGHRPAGAVTSAELERLRDRLLDDEYAAGSLHRTFGALKKAYAWGLRHKVILGDNPVAGLALPSPAASLDYLSRDEVGRLFAYLDSAEGLAPALSPMVRVAVMAGLRKGEAFGLRWRDVHLEAGRLDVMRSYSLLPKGGKPRHLPLHPDLVPVLTAWQRVCPETEEGLVFPVLTAGAWAMGRRDSLLDLADALKAARCHLPAKPWHCLRHTFASHFMMAGGNILTLQKLLGHAAIAMTLRYSHLSPDHMAAELARMSFPGAPVTPLLPAANTGSTSSRNQS